MVGELWANFPRLLEQNINGLLDEATPNSVKAYHLYKACQMENVWSENFEKFNFVLNVFFSIPRPMRNKSDLDQLLEKPLDTQAFGAFHLTFRTGTIKESSLLNLAQWAYNLIRKAKHINSDATSMEVILQTLRNITRPAPFEKDENIEFADFCRAWKKTVFKKSGQVFDNELDALVQELTEINEQIRLAEKMSQQLGFRPSSFTSLEMEWILEVENSCLKDTKIPRLSLSSAKEKLSLLELDRVISLYHIVQTTQLPELLRHKENIRVTLLDRCEKLLGRTTPANQKDLNEQIRQIKTSNVLKSKN